MKVVLFYCKQQKHLHLSSLKVFVQNALHLLQVHLIFLNLNHRFFPFKLPIISIISVVDGLINVLISNLIVFFNNNKVIKGYLPLLIVQQVPADRPTRSSRPPRRAAGARPAQPRLGERGLVAEEPQHEVRDRGRAARPAAA